ncbi:MAG: cobyric acid synthase [Candidatus Omnitrophica bacterium]|nr:cobyric acid synthase [Candidatus Omnitrophota bacterium]
MKKKARAIMVQGTGSGVGKSVVVSALCRIFLQDGFSVCPFKAQNMALNSFVTESGGEIGRAQATQAEACRIKPTPDMNPILIKPTKDTSAQVILHGRPVSNMSVYRYKDYKKTAFGKVKESFNRLSGEYEIVVMEGAGSPAEINLKAQDIVNMKMAKTADSPVILVGDIDRGGVFAWLVGTLELLDREERKKVKGFIINKFRGDKRLLRPGIRFLEQYTGIKVLGVIPYFRDIKIPEEDAVPLDEKSRCRQMGKKLRIAVVYLPHISNFTDFDALGNEPDVVLRYVTSVKELGSPDLIIIPGTKNTAGDLEYLKKAGLTDRIMYLFKSGTVELAGICGGYQMLGEKISDPQSMEGKEKEMKGLALLPVHTELQKEKTLSQVMAKDPVSGIEVTGYEIHHGRTNFTSAAMPRFKVSKVLGKKVKRDDGARTRDGRCWGTYIHGIFDNDGFRRHFLNNLRKKKGWPARESGARYDVDREIDKLAGLVRKNINLDLLYKILSKK